MESLLDLLRSPDKRWLTVPRFAIPMWCGIVASILMSGGQPHLATPAILVCVLGIARLRWFRLLPHETNRLAAARSSLASARPDLGIGILRRELACTGTHYHLQQAILLSRAYIREGGQFLDAHAVLSEIDESHLLDDESVRLSCAWAGLFLEAGNLTEAARRLADVGDDDCLGDTECLLLKSWAALEAGETKESRALLELGLDRNQSAEQRVLLLNNLAAVEGAQGRPEAQLERLQAARTLFQQAPRADLTRVLHHNLAIALVRAREPDIAREVLREAWTVGDESNLRDVLEVLNNNLLAAREAGDESWKLAVYEEFERQLIRLGPLTAREQLALDISELRMRRNDGIALRSPNYEAVIEHLVGGLNQLAVAIPTGDRVAALFEIRHDLQQEIEKRPVAADISCLVALANRVAACLLENQDVVDTHLQALSPKLIGPLVTWRAYQTEIDKAAIQLARTQEAKNAALTQLFSHLREKAEWLSEQGMAVDAIEAWIILCDEYVAYHDRIPKSEHTAFQHEYLRLAGHALEQAAALIEQQSILREHVHHMIGVAYFSLRLRDDRAAAAQWMAKVGLLKPALGQYAGWLRKRYEWVQWRLAHGSDKNAYEI